MKILIIDIETTGFLPTGKICEIGIISLDLETGDKKVLFDQVINPGLTREELDKAWIVENKYMTAEEILAGVPFEEVKERIQNGINKYTNGATAFNRDFDVKFLESYGITFPNKLPCPMLLATPICKLPGKFNSYKWPKVEEAYKFFFPESNYVEKHRGADDAYYEADIVYALHKMNCFIKEPKNITHD